MGLAFKVFLYVFFHTAIVVHILLPVWLEYPDSNWTTLLFRVYYLVLVLNIVSFFRRKENA
jgi:hypothetical protein